MSIYIELFDWKNKKLEADSEKLYAHIMTRIKQVEIHARRVRRVKLQKLRQKYTAAKTGLQKEKILNSQARIAPWLSEELFLAPLKKK